MKRTFRFYKTANDRWYIDLPEWTGSIDELEMVQGADTMLDKVSRNTNECYIELSDEPFDGADIIKLVADLTDSIGGGYYFMESYKGEVVNQEMWLCRVIEWVFTDMPQVIYFAVASYPSR